jgi:hypothetical protein
MNNEAKVRQLTSLVVLERGKGKVISFKDIKVARAVCAAKEVIKGKGKRGRKHKSAMLEADEPELDEPEVARAVEEVINGRGKHGWKRKSAAPEADEPEVEAEPEVAWMIEAPEPRRAPVARMY